MLNRNLQIRSAQSDEANSILMMLHELGYSQVEMGTLSTRLYEVLNYPNMGVFVGTIGDAVVGFISYSYKTQLRLAGKRLEVDELCVKLEYRGQGVGALLLNYLKDRAIEFGVSEVIISTSRDRESYKRKFYERHGYVEKNSACYKLDL